MYSHVDVCSLIQLDVIYILYMTGVTYRIDKGIVNKRPIETPCMIPPEEECKCQKYYFVGKQI